MEQAKKSESAEASAEQVTRYLLDELHQEEREFLEQRICRDPQFFEFISAVEDDLILSYVRGDVAGEARMRFESVYLNNPSKRARVQGMRALRDSLQRTEAGRDRQQSLLRIFSTNLRWPAAVAAGVLLAILLWPLWKSVRSTQVPSPPEKVLRASAGQIASFVLEPGLVRSGSGTQINIPSTTRVAQFELITPASINQAKYEAVLETPERPAIWKGAAVREGTNASVSVPTEVLSMGDYTLSLFPASHNQESRPVATYYFRIVR